MSTQGSSFPGTSGSEEAAEGCASLISGRKLKVTLLSSEWGSTKGGLSTFNRELAIQLAKKENVEVSMYLPSCSKEDEREADGFSVHVITAKRKPGYDPIDWLGSVPRDHCMDVVIGHGIHLGRQIPMIKQLHPNCKWVQVVHTDPEELAMFKDYADPTVRGEKKHQAEVKLCKLADQVVAVGPKLAEAFTRYLRSCGKDQDVINLTPGIFSEFTNVNQAAEGGGTFRVLVFGRGDREDFLVKGYDIAARAVAKLKDEERSFKLVFVGAPDGEEEKVKKRFLQEGISPVQLIVRRAKERGQLVKEFCEADLVIMPSRTEGFGLAALEALSAGLPVLVSGNSGIAKALKELSYGSQCVVNSEKPKKWAKKILAVCSKKRQLRLKEAIYLRQSYAKTYQWEEQCSKLVQKMLKMIKETSVAPNQVVNSDEQGSSAILETVQPHILDDVVNSRSENESQDVHHGASGDEQVSLREYGESFVKLFIRTKSLKKETKEVIEEELTKAVQKYLKLNDHSGDSAQAMKSLTDHLIKVYNARLVTFGMGGEPETSTPEKKTQNTDIPERVDYATFDRVYSSLRSYHLESCIGSQAMIQHGETSTASDQAVVAVNLGEQGPSSISEVVHPDLTAKNQHIVGGVVSSGRENEIQRKRLSHLSVTTTVKRQRQNASIPEKIQRKRNLRPCFTTTAKRHRWKASIPEKIQRKRPLHPSFTTTAKRHRRKVSFPEKMVDADRKGRVYTTNKRPFQSLLVDYQKARGVQ